MAVGTQQEIRDLKTINANHPIELMELAKVPNRNERQAIAGSRNRAAARPLLDVPEPVFERITPRAIQLR